MPTAFSRIIEIVAEFIWLFGVNNLILPGVIMNFMSNIFNLICCGGKILT